MARYFEELALHLPSKLVIQNGMLPITFQLILHVSFVRLADVCPDSGEWPLRALGSRFEVVIRQLAPNVEAMKLQTANANEADLADHCSHCGVRILRAAGHKQFGALACRSNRLHCEGGYRNTGANSGGLG